MILVSSILVMITRFGKHDLAAGKSPWMRHSRKPKEVGGRILPHAKRFLTLDLNDPDWDGTRSVGLYLMPNPASYADGTRVYGATILDQSAVAHSARFITDGRNCLIIFVNTAGPSMPFRMRPWSRRIAVTGTLPDTVTSSEPHDETSTCVQKLCDAARSIINSDHPKSRSDVNKIRRRIAKLLHPDLDQAMNGTCRARAMAIMNAELDEMVFRLAA
ncbi:hypothetical protein HPT29_027270 (plasmid) [Microvirga terrae]|uniref:J domain-containing protein n=1 Tax=Microvirga terrae TaxID=2740529 RepID=A0ABY5RZP6_9HYPH|nr:hypothetical protein [Microvirga terrae]UVF22728.1 hypothetical protein HPT29_027270 [Microvirga terrae]